MKKLRLDCFPLVISLFSSLIISNIFEITLFTVYYHSVEQYGSVHVH